MRDGVRLLTELGALVDGDATRLSETGRRLARLPVDPRIGRMVLEADKLGCLHEVTVIAAGLSAQDPRERPAEKADEADAAHARFTDPRSDFLSWVHLWEHVRSGRRELSSQPVPQALRGRVPQLPAHPRVAGPRRAAAPARRRAGAHPQRAGRRS